MVPFIFASYIILALCLGVWWRGCGQLRLIQHCPGGYQHGNVKGLSEGVYALKGSYLTLHGISQPLAYVMKVCVLLRSRHKDYGPTVG